MTSSTPQSSTLTPEQQQIRRDTDTRAAQDSVQLAIHLLDRAGWSDLAWKLIEIKRDVLERRKAGI